MMPGRVGVSVAGNHLGLAAAFDLPAARALATALSFSGCLALGFGVAHPAL